MSGVVKKYFSYADIHKTISASVPELRAWKPDVLVAIGGGGFIPSRILRTSLRVPILAVTLELYDAGNLAGKEVVKKQWFDEASEHGKLVRDHRVLIVDEVDDTRSTLQYCAQEIIHNHSPAALAVFVVHNKIKPKKGRLDQIKVNPCSAAVVDKPSSSDENLSATMSSREIYFPVKYFAGQHVEDKWNCYPWDAEAYGNDIDTHERLSKQT